MHSEHPTQLGLSDFATTAAGSDAAGPLFPWCLTLRPTEAARKLGLGGGEGQQHEIATDKFIDSLLAIPPYTHLYDVIACPSPASVEWVAHAVQQKTDDGESALCMQRIGKVVTTSACVQSATDGFLFFKHQKKEEDYTIRPEWKEQLTSFHKKVGGVFFDEILPQLQQCPKADVCSAGRHLMDFEARVISCDAASDDVDHDFVLVGDSPEL
jgi:hypothetical protein